MVRVGGSGHKCSQPEQIALWGPGRRAEQGLFATLGFLYMKCWERLRHVLSA